MSGKCGFECGNNDELLWFILLFLLLFQCSGLGGIFNGFGGCKN